MSSRHFDEDWIMDLCFFLEVKKLEHGLSKRSMEVKLPALLENYERPTYRRGAAERPGYSEISLPRTAISLIVGVTL